MRGSRPWSVRELLEQAEAGHSREANQTAVPGEAGQVSVVGEALWLANGPRR